METHLKFKSKRDEEEIIDTRANVIKRPSKTKAFIIPPEHGVVPYNQPSPLHRSDDGFVTPSKPMLHEPLKFTPIAQDQVNSFVLSSVRPSHAAKPN